MQLSVVIPAHDEEKTLPDCVAALSEALGSCAADPELIIVDDGSRDTTWQIVRDLSVRHPFLRGVRFTRSFGKEMAIVAGLQSCTGDAAVVLDADLQHPPSLIPEMLKIWRSQKVSIVEARKVGRQREGIARRLSSHVFYRLFRRSTGLDLEGATDFKLLDREVVDSYLALPERNQFFRGLTSWLGYPTAVVPFTAADSRRPEGSRWSLLALARFGWHSLAAFTVVPLRLITMLGVITLAITVILVAQTLWRYFQESAEPGFATVILIQLGIGSVIMISVGLLGEYLGQIYDELKRRPKFVIRERIGAASEPKRPRGES